MARYPKCRYCKEDVVDKEQAVKKGSTWIHLKCEDAEEEYKEANKSMYRKLLDYINDLYENPNFPVIVKQIKDMTENKGFKEGGILMTLKYIYEIEGFSVQEDRGIGLVEYKYDEAKRYYEQQTEIRQLGDEFDFTYKPIVMTKNPQLDNRVNREPIDMDKLI